MISMSDANLEVRMHNVEEVLGRIETKLDVALKDIDDHECRLRAIEGKSGGRWESLVGQIIGLVAAGAVGWMIAQLLQGR